MTRTVTSCSAPAAAHVALFSVSLPANCKNISPLSAKSCLGLRFFLRGVGMVRVLSIRLSGEAYGR